MGQQRARPTSSSPGQSATRPSRICRQRCHGSAYNWKTACTGHAQTAQLVWLLLSTAPPRPRKSWWIPHPPGAPAMAVNPQRGCLGSLVVQSQLSQWEEGESGPPRCLGMYPDCQVLNLNRLPLGYHLRRAEHLRSIPRLPSGGRDHWAARSGGKESPSGVNTQARSTTFCPQRPT